MLPRGDQFRFPGPADAVAALIARTTPLPAEPCPLALARGRILARDVLADRDSPPFEYSAMDGYAVRASNFNPVVPGVIPVDDEARIGRSPPPMPSGRAAVRIATGAPLPAGADAVFKREDLIEHPDGRTIELTPATPAPRPGDHVRRRGENARSGDTVAAAGSLISSAVLGTLAAVGQTLPLVHQAVRVAVISTGDEVVAADQTPGPHQIRDSNRPAIIEQMTAHRWAQVLSSVHVHDDGALLAGHLARALAEAHAVILTGGVSMGHRDPVRACIEQSGAAIAFHGLPQRPGKPILAAIGPDHQLVFGLPGNPVSALLTCTRIVIPVLAARAGMRSSPPVPSIRIANPDARRADLWWHRLVRLTDAGDAELVELRGSGDIIAAGRADGFVEIPPGEDPAAGPFPFYAWSS